MKKCSDIMTENLVYCMPDDTVAKAAQLMKKEDIGPVLIVDNQRTKKLVGIVTDRDLALKVVGEGRDPQNTRVEDVMTRKMVTCRADDDVESAMSAMAQYQLRRIPVVGDNMKLLGIISQADVATRVDEPEKTGEVVKEISHS
ncbi:MAG TPA: CBS domain-containing protein [Anaerolineales bacterium]|nr:CBS domain-containing protein [Anaerolineales bacterium]HLO33328.1 CBS domain-containing protein [Anaerolineales bacterium]